jgi:pyruvate dehydrogenase E2 component (dihydrolipoamide acetyltransferase)
MTLIALVCCLHRTIHLIAPDLPGFGNSTTTIPDYSIRAHARYVLQMMDAMKVDRFHIVGFSLGGGVALNLANLAPERVKSITMLSAIGVQEMELSETTISITQSTAPSLRASG